MGDRLVELQLPELRRLALLEMISRARAEPTQPIPGLSELTLRILRDPHAEAVLAKLLDMNAVRVLINTHLLNFRCEHLELKEFEEAALQYFINAQASNKLIRRCFPATGRRRIDLVRKALGVPPPARAQQLSETLGHRIYRVWQEICRETQDTRERYIALHGEFPHLTLTTLHATLNAGDVAED
ncbi:MAG: hypothetical protein EPN74_02015 [Rhodanobacter sp.]|nr:MAG: hypothetical protein EPN74_02015 [Rhodanobacter sp.]